MKQSCSANEHHMFCLSLVLFVCLFVFKNGIIRLEAGAFKFLRNRYDTVARADNYFTEYRMLFSRCHSNERDIFRGSCIDVIKSRLRKNLKAPASSRIMPFSKTNKQTNKTKLRQNMWCSFTALFFHIDPTFYSLNGECLW
jgi:hypothetical protein